jgi:hypothetical protein
MLKVAGGKKVGKVATVIYTKRYLLCDEIVGGLSDLEFLYGSGYFLGDVSRSLGGVLVEFVVLELVEDGREFREVVGYGIIRTLT